MKFEEVYTKERLMEIESHLHNLKQYERLMMLQRILEDAYEIGRSEDKEEGLKEKL